MKHVPLENLIVHNTFNTFPPMLLECYPEGEGGTLGKFRWGVWHAS